MFLKKNSDGKDIKLQGMSQYIPNTLFNVISEHFSEIMLRTGA
jgi:hypothetical protein